MNPCFVLGSVPVQEMLSIAWPGDDLLVVSGGSPSSLVDAYSVTLIDNDKNYTLQLTSPVKGMESQDLGMESGLCTLLRLVEGDSHIKCLFMNRGSLNTGGYENRFT